MDKNLVSEVMRAMGSKGGKIGGKKRMAAMSAGARRALAKKAAAESVKVRSHIYRRHEKDCTYRETGIPCNCPMWLAEFRTKDGELVHTHSLRTRSWQVAKERLASLGEDGPTELPIPKGRLYRLHSLTCPHRKLGRRHVQCSCPVWADYYREGKLRRLSVRTRDWREAKERLASLENGQVLLPEKSTRESGKKAITRASNA